MSDYERERLDEAARLFNELTKNWTVEERFEAFLKLRPLFDGGAVVEIPIPERLQMVEEE